MKAILIRKYGSSQVLEYTDLPRPSIKAKEVLVKVHASSVNPIDWKLRYGVLKFLTRHKLPFVLGCDISGEIVATGHKVHNFQVGDLVYAMLDTLTSGAYAEYVRVPVESVALKPNKMSHQEAAAVPLAALTSLQALRDKGKMKGGDKVLINGASGGVGLYALQIANALGAEVTAVCSGKNMNLAKEFGADKVIDYTQADFTQGDEVYNIVFDVVGNKSLIACKSVMAADGIYITSQPGPKEFVNSLWSLFSRRKSKVIMVKPSGRDLQILGDLVEAEQLRSHIDKVYPLSEVAAAHEHSESNRVRGKIVIEVL